jgi:hypothetical protein
LAPSSPTHLLDDTRLNGVGQALVVTIRDERELGARDAAQTALGVWIRRNRVRDGARISQRDVFRCVAERGGARLTLNSRIST